LQGFENARRDNWIRAEIGALLVAENGGAGQEIAARFPFSQLNRRALRLQAQVASQARRMRLETPATPRVPRVQPAACWRMVEAESKKSLRDFLLVS
jgi:hypothetical protein